MASKFVRCIKNVEDITKLSDNVTEENDIVSDVHGNIYIRKDVGFHKLYDGDGINVDEQLEEIMQDIESLEKDLNKIDLTIYAKKSDLIEYVKEGDLTLYAKKTDLDTYARKSDLTLYAKFTDLDTYAKKSELAVYVKVTDLNEYAKKSELPDLTEYAKKTDIPNTENWQKHQLTQDDGYVRIVNKPSLLPKDLDTLMDKVGMVYVTTPTGSPHSSGASGFVKSIFRSGGYGILEFQPYSAKNIYQIRRTTSGWGEWYEITNYIAPPDLTPYAKKTDLNNLITDTGWQNLELLNEVQAYSEQGTPQYRVTRYNGVTEVSIRGEVKNISAPRITIANLPIDDVLTQQYPFVQPTSLKQVFDDEKVGTFARWAIKTDKSIVLENVSYKANLMTNNDWFPINATFKI